MKKYLSIFIMIIMVVTLLTACAQKEEQTPETGNETIEGTIIESDAPAGNTAEDEPGSTKEVSLVDTWQTEDGDFIYEMLDSGVLHVTSQYGTDESCSWTMDGNTVSFSFSDGAGIVYQYNAEKDILECEDDPSWFLVRS